MVIKNLYGSDGSSGPKRLPKSLERTAKEPNGSLSLAGSWGSYVIQDGIIKIQTIHPSASLNNGWEDHFKIKDKNNILHI